MLDELNELMKINNKDNVDSIELSEEIIASLLNTDVNALKAFEEAYAKASINQEIPDNLFELSAKDAKNLNNNNCSIPSDMNTIIKKIVNELIDGSHMYTYDGSKGEYSVKRALYNYEMVTKKEIMSIPEELRPQLTGTMMSVDIPEQSYKVLLFYYNKWIETKDISFYHHFRQGLDILDLDSLTYKIIGMNDNSMGVWLPRLVEANQDKDFFKIPKTKILKVPMTLLQLTRQDYMTLTPTTKKILNEYIQNVFNLDPENGDYFIKTGTYSSKFDFRNAHVSDSQEIRELGEYLLYIHFQALQMASPLNIPVIYGVSTTNEWVVREYIKDKEDNMTIYHGMPLHTEYRVFVDCDKNEVIGVENYWKPEVMIQRFDQKRNIDDGHDSITYKGNMPRLVERYNKNVEKVCKHVKELLPDLNLNGQWSIDVMQNDDDFWLIDMALAESSAFYNCVPNHLRNPMIENWLPNITHQEGGYNE